MASVYPGALDTLKTDVNGATDTLQSVPHDALHNNQAAAINAVQATLGVDPQGASATVAARVAGLDMRAPTYGTAPASPQTGQTWIKRDAGLFIAVGTWFGWSADAVTWTAATGWSGKFNDVAWSPSLGLAVAVGNGGIAYYSTDGKAWTASSVGGTDDVKSVDWSPTLGLFVAAGDLVGTWWSTDGKAWTAGTGLGLGANGITWSPTLGIFAAATRSSPYVAWSTDGKTWSNGTVTSSFTMSRIAWSPALGLFVAAGGTNFAYWSTDGKAWTAGTFAGGGSDTTAAAWSPELGIFVLTTPGAAKYWSTDGKTWTAGTGGDGAWSVAWSPDLGAFAAGAGTVALSTDGKTWTPSGGNAGTPAGLLWKPSSPPTLMVYDGGWQHVV